MAPGLSKQWRLSPNFDYLTSDLTRHMKVRGIVVPPADQWIDSYDRTSPTAWHAKQSNDNVAMMTT
eukprot:1232136-Pyramimonas_sp.AAC.1